MADFFKRWFDRRVLIAELDVKLAASHKEREFYEFHFKEAAAENKRLQTELREEIRSSQQRDDGWTQRLLAISNIALMPERESLVKEQPEIPPNSLSEADQKTLWQVAAAMTRSKFGREPTHDEIDEHYEAMIPIAHEYL